MTLEDAKTRLEAAGFDFARVDGETAEDAATVFVALCEGRVRALVCSGPENGGARALAEAVAKDGAFGHIQMREPWSEFELTKRWPNAAFPVHVDASLFLDGVGLERHNDPAALSAFLDIWLARRGVDRRRPRLVLWTPLDSAGLAARLGAHVFSRLAASAQQIYIEPCADTPNA